MTAALATRPTTVARPQIRIAATRDEVLSIARAAIVRRLGYSSPAAIRSLTAAVGGHVLTLNSGGNAMTVAWHLVDHGFRVTDLGLTDEGIALHVALAA